MHNKISALEVRKYTLIISVITLFLFVTFVNAQMPESINNSEADVEEAIANIDDQEIAEIVKNRSWSSGGSSEDQVSCFDYYEFQSVQVSMDTSSSQYKDGEVITFSGSIINKNNYPVVDGNVFVRIYRENDNYAEEGNFIIDEFIALENVFLREDEEQSASFDWQAPGNLKVGEYGADYFFSVGKKFNLGGLPFSNEVIIGTSNFSIDSENDNYISFDRSATRVNGEKYLHIGDIPVFGSEEVVNIEQVLENNYSEDRKVEVTYDLYFWDSLNEEDKISTKTEEVTIPANSSNVIKYAVEKMNDSVYYLKITAKSVDDKSIINTRFANKELNRSRLNYPAITKFPLRRGDDFTLFSCYHNSSLGEAQGKVSVKLLDKNNKEVGSLEYEGVIYSNMMVSKENIKASRDYDYLKLVANVYDEKNNIVDHYETEYDCEKMDSCGKFIKRVDAAKEMDGMPALSNSSPVKILIVVFSIIAIATVAVVLINKRNK